MAIRVYEKPKRKTYTKEELKEMRPKDIIIYQTVEKITYEGNKEIKTKEVESVNLTKKIRETAKTIKKESTAEQKLRKINEIAKGL